MLLFSLKKWMGAFLQPLPILVLLFIFALIFQIKGRRKLAIGCQSLAIIGLLFAATPPLSGAFIKHIEGDTPPFEEQIKVDYIVVLGCGHHNSAHRPITSELAPCSLYRTTEGVRLFQLNPDATLIFSGYGGIQAKSNAETNKELALALNVPEDKIIVEPRARDTKEEAQYLSQRLSNQSFALVTSASHMTRALAFFRAENLDPIPAPTGHLYVPLDSITARGFLPNSNSLHQTGVSTYESLGRLWQWLTN